MTYNFQETIQKSIGVHHLVSSTLGPKLQEAAQLMIDALGNEKKILIAGNGGSAAQAQHMTGELVGRFLIERNALPAITLSADTSILTAWSNDYSFETVFSRQVEALGKEGDILFALSTSGNSANVIKAVEAARVARMKVILLLGKDGGKMKGLADVELVVPSNSTPRIQESHILMIHMLCECVELELFGKQELITTH